MRTVEINGIKLEIDERTARTVDQYKVGDKVKVLVKGYDGYHIYPGVIVGFSNFAKLPTIDVLYVKTNAWSSDAFAFAYINEESNDVELCPFNEVECLLDKEQVIANFDRAIATKESELSEMRTKRQYFIERFATAFDTTKEAA